jgi:hypothetical protein
VRFRDSKTCSPEKEVDCSYPKEPKKDSFEATTLVIGIGFIRFNERTEVGLGSRIFQLN